MQAKRPCLLRLIVLLLSLHSFSVCLGAELADHSTPTGETGDEDSVQYEDGTTTLAAEYEFRLEKPLAPAPLAEAIPVSRPRIRAEKQETRQPKSRYRYYFTREEIIEHEESEQPRTVKRALEEMYRQRYARPDKKSYLDTVMRERYLPNSLEAESVAAHLRESREKTIREACRKNLSLIGNAVDNYFRDNPDEIIKKFDEDDATSLHGRFFRYGYLKEPIKIPNGCHYVNESRLSELVSGAQIYCTRHDNP